MAILVASLPGWIALLAAAIGVLSVRKLHPRLAALTAALLVAAGLTGSLWLAAFCATWPHRWLLPTSQKVAWVLLVTWAFVASVVAARAPSASDGVSLRSGC